MRTVRFEIPKPLWMSANRPVKHHGHRQRVRDGLHDIAIIAARAQRLERFREPVTVVWEVRYPKGVGWATGDAANALPTSKALLDGLVHAGYLRDDGPRDVTAETFTRGANLDVPGRHDILATFAQASS